MRRTYKKKLRGKNKPLVICRGWIAMGTLAAYAAMGAARPALAAGKALPTADGVPPATPASEAIRYSCGPTGSSDRGL